MAGKVKSICEENISPLIEDLGYEVVDIEYVKKSDGMNLIFYIDKDDGIQIEDCEKVSRAIDQKLEEVNPTDNQTYILSVSSPGIDRPLKTNKDFTRHLEKEISIKLFSKINGKKVIEGILKNFDEKSITIESKNENISIDKNKIAQIVPIIKF